MLSVRYWKARQACGRKGVAKMRRGGVRGVREARWPKGGREESVTSKRVRGVRTVRIQRACASLSCVESLWVTFLES